jgi:hypothetical protein
MLDSIISTKAAGSSKPHAGLIILRADLSGVAAEAPRRSRFKSEFQHLWFQIMSLRWFPGRRGVSAMDAMSVALIVLRDRRGSKTRREHLASF